MGQQSWLFRCSAPGPGILGDLRAPDADQGASVAEGVRQRGAGGGTGNDLGVFEGVCITSMVNHWVNMVDS